MRGQGWEDQVVLCIEGPQHGSFHICEHLSNWWLKRNCRTFHMATLLQAWIKQATSRAGRGGVFLSQGQQSQRSGRKNTGRDYSRGSTANCVLSFPVQSCPCRIKGGWGLGPVIWADGK